MAHRLRKQGRKGGRNMTRTVKRIVHVVAFVLASQVLPFQTDAGQGAYTMMVNHGQGWSAAGDYASLKACQGEAADYALSRKAQAGCTTAAAAAEAAANGQAVEQPH